jgi:hypothetical protein
MRAYPLNSDTTDTLSTGILNKTSHVQQSEYILNLISFARKMPLRSIQNQIAFNVNYWREREELCQGIWNTITRRKKCSRYQNYGDAPDPLVLSFMDKKLIRS